MHKVVEAYFHLLKVVMVLCLLGMVVMVFGNVVLRYGFNSGITVSEEVSRLFFLYLTFLGAIVAMREHLHLGIDSVVKRLPRSGKKFCLIASQLLMLFITWLFLQGSWQQTVINWTVKMPVTGISMAAFYGVGLIFSVSVGLILLYDLYRAVTNQLTDKDLVIVKESEEAAELEELENELRKHGSNKENLGAVKPT
jgi:TRAP-type C4-dicarboxylate transport system permease small subunit